MSDFEIGALIGGAAIVVAAFVVVLRNFRGRSSSKPKISFDKDIPPGDRPIGSG